MRLPRVLVRSSGCTKFVVKKLGLCRYTQPTVYVYYAHTTGRISSRTRRVSRTVATAHACLQGEKQRAAACYAWHPVAPSPFPRARSPRDIRLREEATRSSRVVTSVSNNSSAEVLRDALASSTNTRLFTAPRLANTICGYADFRGARTREKLRKNKGWL